MRYYVPGSIIQRAVESVGSQLGDTISNIPDMLRAKEERERRRRLEDEDRIARNSQIEWQRRREATADNRADTLFNQGQKDYEAQAPVRERAIKEGQLRAGYIKRRDQFIQALNQPEYQDLLQQVIGAQDDEAEFERRVAAISGELQRRAAAKQKADEEFRLRVAYANRPPDAFELYRKKALFDTATDLHGRGLTPATIDQVEQANQAPAGLGEWALKLGSTLFPGLKSFVPEARTSPVDLQLQSTIGLARQNPYFGVPAQTRRSEEVRMALQEAQAERQRQPNASVEAQLARLDLRKKEQVNRALQQYYEGKVDDRTFHAQLKSLGLTNEEIAGLFESPPDSP